MKGLIEKLDEININDNKNLNLLAWGPEAAGVTGPGNVGGRLWTS